MKNIVKQNSGKSHRNSKSGNNDKKNDEQEEYVDDIDCGSEVTKRNPNLVETGLEKSADEFENDLDDDEDTE